MEGTEKVPIDVEGKLMMTTDGGDSQPKKSLKRKRTYSSPAPLTDDQRAAQMEALTAEMEGLFRYYREMIAEKGGLDLGLDLSGNKCSSNGLNGMVGLLLEESDLSLSSLVEEIHGKLVGLVKEGLTVAAVKAAVLFVGQRVMYGVPNVDADVLEDETQESLWCWETRDLKLLPKSVRGILKIRRTCRKKILERIMAVSETIAAFKKSERDKTYGSDLLKASDKLGKVLREADIRSFVHGMLQKNGAELDTKETKCEEKLLMKQLEKNKREALKEKKRLELEALKEKRQAEREQRQLQELAEKDERRREKEESEMRRQLRKQQEETEKEQRRREREEAELKRQLSVKKQASIMEQFLKRGKSNSPCVSDMTSTNATTSASSSILIEKIPEATTQSMDCTLSANNDIASGEILESHLSSWHRLGRFIRCNREQHWSRRQKPKVELFKELKLCDTRELVHDEDSSMEKLASEWREQSSHIKSCMDSSDTRKCNRRKQLLQFDKSYRPAFFGIWPKKSGVVGPRHPLRKDPDLDYEIDSDEEWEEEDPGESLSDCEKDEEDSLEEGCSKADEESEDEFFVPDGYLSENEGVQDDKMEADFSVVEARHSPSSMKGLDSEEFVALFQQQKYVNNLTDSALRKNQPMIILNLMHEKVPLLLAEDQRGDSKHEKMFLQALGMRAFSGGPPIEISVDHVQSEDQDAAVSNDKASTPPIPTVTGLQASDMLTVVSAIQTCSQGINKILEFLQQKFPTVSKSQLRNKVREISEYVDNHWQVKKEILDEIGMSISPGKGRRRTQSISTFFSKRCIPPTGNSINNPNEVSPQPSLKHGSVVEEYQINASSHP